MLAAEPGDRSIAPTSGLGRDVVTAVSPFRFDGIHRVNVDPVENPGFRTLPSLGFPMEVGLCGNGPAETPARAGAVKMDELSISGTMGLP